MIIGYKDIHTFDRNENYLQYVQSRCGLRTPSMLRAGCLTLLPWRGGGTICPGSRPAGVTARIPRMVTECLLTRSMLIKIHYRFMVCACVCTIVFTASQFHADVYLVYLVFHIA